MRLRNKETGQEGNFIINKDHFECTDLEYVPEYHSLAELSKEWEDHEESKNYYIINLWGEVSMEDGKYQKPGLSELGLTFETREEAEKAVERLRAWKRLKDKGFRFNGKEVFSEGLLEIDGILSALEGIDNAERLKIIDDLDLLFSWGEE